MGAAQSSDDATSEISLSGWRVLKVQRNGPCDGLGLVPYFDIITHFNTVQLNEDEKALMQAIQPNQRLVLNVFSLSTRQSRTLSVTPQSNWGGDGLLGLMIRFDHVESSDLECMHVLNVYPNSPAYHAGLQPYSDWLLGTERLAFKGWEQLDHWLGQSNNRLSTICVFNSSTWRIREIPIKPSSSWGGNGALGCDLAQGYKHRLPAFDHPTRRPVTMDHRSEIRLSSTPQTSGLHREDDQLMMHLNVNDVMMYVRVREPEEMAVRTLPAPINQHPSPQSQSTTNHAQQTNSHSHPHMSNSLSHQSPNSAASSMLPSRPAYQPANGVVTPAAYQPIGAVTSAAAYQPTIQPINASHVSYQLSSPTGKRVLQPKLPTSTSASPTLSTTTIKQPNHSTLPSQSSDSMPDFT